MGTCVLGGKCGGVRKFGGEGGCGWIQIAFQVEIIFSKI